jgi:hypothetical protein
MNNHELVEFIQQRERELEEVSSILQSVRNKLNETRAKSQIESAERRARLNVLLVKAGRPTLPIIKLEEK